MIVKELQTFTRLLERQVYMTKDRAWLMFLDDANKTLTPVHGIVGQ